MILDADILIDILRARPNAVAWLGSLTNLPAVSGAAALEVLFGARDATELQRVQRFLLRFTILWPNEVDMQSAASLAQLKLSDGIELLDAVTASLSIRHGVPLGTFNLKHFRVVPGLQTIQPFLR